MMIWARRTNLELKQKLKKHLNFRLPDSQHHHADGPTHTQGGDGNCRKLYV